MGQRPLGFCTLPKNTIPVTNLSNFRQDFPGIFKFCVSFPKIWTLSKYETKMKILQILFLFSFVTCVVACGGGTETTTTETDTTSTEATSTDDTTPEVEEPEAPSGPDMSDEDVSTLARKWQLTAFTHIDGQKEENIEGDFLYLNEDGSYTEIVKLDTIVGTWDLDKTEGKVLMLKPTTGKFAGQTEKLAIEELSAEQMITSDDDGKMTETFVVVPE